MYTGLILLPWVMFFGFSGVLFNHSEWFGSVEVLSEFSGSEVAELSDEAMPDPEAIADRVVARLNAAKAPDGVGGAGAEKRGPYRRPASDRAVVEGAFRYTANTDAGRAMLTISPTGKGATVKRSEVSPDQEKAPFHGEIVGPAGFDPGANGELARELFERSGIEPEGSVEPGTRGGTEIRFRVETPEDGRRWNAVYSLASGEVSARAADAPHGMSLNALLGRLHKTHHYPDRRSARWFWNFLADATGITMVFWGLSGVIMWWQLKPTRLLGVLGLSAAAVLAALVFTGTFSHLTFGPRAERRGPPAASPRGQKPERRGDNGNQGEAGGKPAPATPGERAKTTSL